MTIVPEVRTVDERGRTTCGDLAITRSLSLSLAHEPSFFCVPHSRLSPPSGYDTVERGFHRITQHTMSAEQPQQQEKTSVLSKESVDAFVKKLDEDDEFEDFPQDEWQDIETQTGSHETKLWEENWEDHDEYKDDFTSKLRYV